MSEKTQLVSLEAADDWLARLDNKHCPWCDGSHWALRGTLRTDMRSTDDVAGLRSLPETRLSVLDDAVKADITYGAGGALPVITARCEDCGFLYLFDYFKVAELCHNAANPKADDHDD